MALITCPEFAHQVSERAVACPHCGYPIADEALLSAQYRVEVSDPPDVELPRTVHLEESPLRAPSPAPPQPPPIPPLHASTNLSPVLKPPIPAHAFEALNRKLQETRKANNQLGCFLIAAAFFLPMSDHGLWAVGAIVFGVRWNVWADLARRSVGAKRDIWINSMLSTIRTALLVSLAWGVITSAWLSHPEAIERLLISSGVRLLLFLPLSAIGGLWAVSAALSVMHDAVRRGNC